MPVVRLKVEATRVHRRWDHAALASDGRILLTAWGPNGAFRYELAGKPLSLPRFEEARVRACGDRFVFVGHPWAAKTDAELIVIGEGSYTIPRRHEAHFLDVWLAGDRVAFVASDRFHVVHGIGLVEGKLGGKTGPVRELASARRAIALHAVLLDGDRRYALASIGYRKHALLALAAKGKSYAARTVFTLQADEAMFSATGAHVVLHRRGAPVQIVALDGTKLATLRPKPHPYAYLSLAAATPGQLAFRGHSRRGDDDDVLIVETSPWPSTA